MSYLVPDPDTDLWLMFFWITRDLVTPEYQCPTPLVYPDGTVCKCVLSREHLDDDLPVDIPHATETGRLAPVLPVRHAIAEAQVLSYETSLN
jgi:hypothetical protein